MAKDPTNFPNRRGMEALNQSIRSISPRRPAIVVGATLPSIIADYQAASHGAGRHSPTELATALYHSSAPYPLPQWLEHWRERRVDCHASDIIQLCIAYRLLIDKYGPRQIDDGSPDPS